MFDSFIGEPLISHPDAQEKINELEKEYGCLVYAVTHEYFDFGECYSFLVVSKHEEDWEHCVRYADFDEDCYFAFAYVWNKTDESCSEFGSVVVKTAWGGLLRVE